MTHARRNWKKYALLAGSVAAAYYGVNPDVGYEILNTVLDFLNAP